MMGFQGKMAAIYVFHNRIWQVALKGFGSGRDAITASISAE